MGLRVRVRLRVRDRVRPRARVSDRGLGFDPLDQPRVEGEGAHAVALELLTHLG